MEHADNKFRTADIYFAAYLKVAGVEFVGTEREGQRVLFVFSAPEGSMRDLKNQYFNRTAKVVALSYADEVKTMKSLTFLDNG